MLKIMEWCEEAGGDITLKHLLREPTAPVSKTDDSNPFWLPFKAAIDELLEIKLLTDFNFFTLTIFSPTEI